MKSRAEMDGKLTIVKVNIDENPKTPTNFGGAFLSQP